MLGFLTKKKLVLRQGLKALIQGIIELDFKYRRKKKRILYHGFSNGYRYKRGKYRVTQKKRNPILIILNTRVPFFLGHPVYLGQHQQQWEFRLQNFFYIIKIINYLPAVIVVAVYYTIMSPDVAKAKFISCIFYQSKSSSSEGFSDGNLGCCHL